MPTTVNKGYTVPVTGTGVGTWGDDLNNNLQSIVDLNLGGTLTKALSSANVTLTATESQYGIVRLTGTLTANVSVTTSCKGFFFVENATAGNFSVTITNGVGTSVIPPQNTTRGVIADATNGCRAVGLEPPGVMKDYGGPASSFPPWLAGEYLLADGSAVSRTTYAALFSIYGTTFGAGNGSTTFNLPDTRGRLVAGRDDMGGSAANRITNAVSGVTGTTVGAAGGGQSVTVAQANLPNYTLPNTLAIASGGAHTHSIAMAGSSGVGGKPLEGSTAGNNATTASDGAHTHAITGSVTSGGSGTALAVLPPVIIVNKLIKT